MKETESIVEKEPLFSLKNYFKPTAKNVTIWGDILVALGGLIGGSAIYGMNPYVAIAGMAISGLGIILQRLTKEEPISTINRAVEDIREEVINETV